MSLLSRLALLFVGVPLLELFILIQMGRLVGLLPTVALVVITGVAGAALARLEGLRTLWSIRGDVARGRLPGNALFDGLAILVGGALLLTPGILTDVLGFSFLLPPTRRRWLKRIRAGVEERIKSGTIQVTHVSGFGVPFGTPFSGGGEAPGGDPSPGGATDPSRPVRGEIVVEPKTRGE